MQAIAEISAFIMRELLKGGQIVHLHAHTRLIHVRAHLAAVEGVGVKVTGELNRPPYEKGNAGAALFEHARSLAAEIGFKLVDTFTGGGSDGNFTAPYTATLDGLGVDGKGAHTHYEQLFISSIEPRARLLHRLYQTLR